MQQLHLAIIHTYGCCQVFLWISRIAMKFQRCSIFILVVLCYSASLSRKLLLFAAKCLRFVSTWSQRRPKGVQNHTAPRRDTCCSRKYASRLGAVHFWTLRGAGGLPTEGPKCFRKHAKTMVSTETDVHGASVKQHFGIKSYIS